MELEMFVAYCITLMWGTAFVCAVMLDVVKKC